VSVEIVKKYLKQWGREKDIIVLEASTATVPEAARALGVIPARIAKSISVKQNEKTAVIVTAGDMKIDNHKYKEYFGIKARMLSPEEALERTGFAVGGVCPFGLPDGVDVYLDISMKRFETVFPACGSGNSAIELTPPELETFSRSKGWVDVTIPIS